jgi:hypothetical protein
MTVYSPRFVRGQRNLDMTHAMQIAARRMPLANALKQQTAFSSWQRGLGALSPLAVALLAA